MSGLNMRAAALAFVIATILCCGSVESKARHYAVRVQDPAELQKVADILTQQGLIVKRINTRFNFVSVQTSDDANAPASASSTEPTAGRAAPCSDPLGCTTGDEASFPGPSAYQTADDVTAAATSDPTIAAAFAALPAGVEIEEDAQVYMMGRRLESSHARSLLQDVAAEASPAAAACSALPDSGMTGRLEEDAPYGIKMVQADDPTMIQLSKDYKSKVMFCIIDTGADRTHWEFSKDGMSGCMPNTKRSTGTTTNCKYDWGVDYYQHGTHTCGTVSALRNGRGVVGVSASGAQVYEYNSFGPEQTFSMTLVVDAWEDCIAELDDRKAKTGMKDMKMVISMSIGSDGDVKVVREAIKQLAAERAKDVMWVAAAGNGAQTGSVYSYPASYPECVSIAAVDWAETRAVFSQVNNEVDWAAPGVQTLSSIPIADAAASGYNQMPSITVTGTQRAQSNLFSAPGPSILSGAKAGTVTAGVVDCGTASATCTGAKGKVCLIVRGGNMFCEKVYNCVQGGGVGAIIYGQSSEPTCETFEGVLDYNGCTKPSGGWPVAMTITRGQGEALQAMMKNDAGVTITLDAREASDPLPFDFLSGTSMATPTASGVAGLVWSAHTDCSASEVRAAISWTALDVGKKGYDREYGYGIVQAAAAHKYLLDHPCNGGNATEPPRSTKSTALRNLKITSSVPRNASPAAVGSTVQFTITVGKTANPQNIANVPVSIEASRHLSCSSTSVNTNAKGVAVTSCDVKSPGTATLTATIGAGQRAVTAVSKLRTVARRSGL